ncbi:hypothetical protein HDU84_005579 [Entophlyctis sp. JEL0112]|nr:hypothetical protein HDU84_005579 [Entophlyctis sp. JEL0112]
MSWVHEAILNFGKAQSRQETDFELELDIMDEIDQRATESESIRNSEFWEEIRARFSSDHDLSQESDRILERLLDEFDTDRLLTGCLAPPTRDISKIRVSNNNYNVDVGDKTTPYLLEIFNSKLKSITKDGLSLPPCLTRDKYFEALSQDRDEFYTLPKHIFVMKTVGFAEIAKQLRERQVPKFKGRDFQAQSNKVKGWAKKALRMIVAKNSIWKAWRVPSEKDMLEACDRLMESWVSVFKNIPSSHGDDDKGQNVYSLSDRDLRWRDRWSDETVDLTAFEARKTSDWRQICRKLRDAAWQNREKQLRDNSWREKPNLVKECALLTYLYHASNSLKHTQYEFVDPRTFLHSARELFELYVVKHAQMQAQFRSLIEKIWLELPASEREAHGLEDVSGGGGAMAELSASLTRLRV